MMHGSTEIVLLEVPIVLLKVLSCETKSQSFGYCQDLPHNLLFA